MSLNYTVIFKGTAGESRKRSVWLLVQENSVRISITNDTTRERAYFLLDDERINGLKRCIMRYFYLM